MSDPATIETIEHSIDSAPDQLVHRYPTRSLPSTPTLPMPVLFLELPGEIRNQILRLLLTHKTPIVTRNAHQLGPPKPTLMGLSPNILLASKRTHAEGLTILYGENVFQAHPSYLTSMLFALDPARTVNSTVCRGLIRRFHVRVRLDCDTFYQKEDVRKVFDGADLLEVEVFRSSWGVGGYEALEGYRDVRGVRKARVHGSLPTLTARWLEACMEGDGEEAADGWGCEEDEEGYWDRFDAWKTSVLADIFAPIVLDVDIRGLEGWDTWGLEL